MIDRSRLFIRGGPAACVALSLGLAAACDGRAPTDAKTDHRAAASSSRSARTAVGADSLTVLIDLEGTVDATVSTAAPGEPAQVRVSELRDGSASSSVGTSSRAATGGLPALPPPPLAPAPKG